MPEIRHDLTRTILTKHGPEVARDKGDGNPSLASIAALILNQHIRPVLTRWHPVLLDHEAGRPPGTGARAWELGWPDRDAARADLLEVREMLRQYLGLLGDAAGARDFADALRAQIGR